VDGAPRLSTRFLTKAALIPHQPSTVRSRPLLRCGRPHWAVLL